MKKIVSVTLLASSLMLTFSISAASFPRGVSADPRVKVVMYDPNNVVVLQGRYGYQTQIVFAPNETVQNVSIGDSMAWQAVPVGNVLFIKPTASSKTDMTVLTSANSYSLQLDSTNLNAQPTYKLQYVYSDGGYDQSGSANALGSCDPSEINWKYSFSGDRSVAPLEAFDCNGQFTYFKFSRNSMNQFPAIFIVDKKRNETLVNYHMQGDYVVVNSVAKQFTMRNGNYVATIYNDYALGDYKKFN